MSDRVSVLLVDDQPARLLSYEAILGDMALDLVRANSGEEALRALMQQEFAVILLDVNMPGMDGFETASLIHQHPRYERTPIIFVTGVHVTDLDRLRGYKLGAFDYVYIPVVPEILRSKVAVLSELYTQRRELERLNESLGRTNAELAEANALLAAEKTRELQALNARLELINKDLGRSNAALQIESTERGRAEERMRFLADTIPSIVWTCAPDGSITYANRNWYEYYGLPAEGGPDHITRLVLHPDDAESVAALVIDRLNAAENFEFEARHRNHEGDYCWFITRAVPWRDADDRVVSWFGVTTSINDLKELMAKLQESDRRKDEFLAILGHELRNPLAPIRNAAQIMRLKGLHDPQLSWLRDVIERQVDHLTRLVDDLLDVSRITRGKIELKKERIDIAEVVARGIESSRPLIDEHRHELVVTQAQGPMIVDGDLTRLSQVLGNLLNNASKYTPAGGRVELAVQRDGDEVAITVRDTGVGIPAEMLGRIFEPFTQVETTRRQAQGGLGIGLALVRRLVEMHDGRIEAASAGADLGSTFVVHLPLMPPDIAVPPAPAGPEGGEHRLQRILVADDNADAADSLAEMLRLEGHEVLVAADGAQAVALAAAHRPEVALLDIGMPGVDGFEAARRIRALDGGNEIVLIALTGWGQQEDRRRTLEAGFDAHRVKPIDHDDLRQLLQHAGDQARQRRVADQSA